MSSVTIYAPKVPTTETGPGGRLYAAFLAGRSPHTLRAYGADLEAFAAYLGESSPGAALSRLISLPAGEGNGLLLAYRAHMIDAGLTPATINRRLAAIRSALKLARTLGLTPWAPENPWAQGRGLSGHDRFRARWHARPTCRLSKTWLGGADKLAALRATLRRLPDDPSEKSPHPNGSRHARSASEWIRRPADAWSLMGRAQFNFTPVDSRRSKCPIVCFSPSRSATVGCHSRCSLASVMSGWRCLGSSSGSGK
jgi:Phage integrase, N-terminal SAM-like domain